MWPRGLPIQVFLTGHGEIGMPNARNRGLGYNGGSDQAIIYNGQMRSANLAGFVVCNSMRDPRSVRIDDTMSRNGSRSACACS